MLIALRLSRYTTHFVMSAVLCSDFRWLFRNQTTSTFECASLVTAVTLYISLQPYNSSVGFTALTNERKWSIAICMLVCVHIAVSVVVPRSFALTAFGDILQNLLLCLATVAFLVSVKTTSGKTRLFWLLMGMGLATWLVSQVMWTYFEVYVRHEAPNPFGGDVILFLHVVPMMAAVAIQPHQKQEGHALRARMLDFALLLTWWLFLYLFVVIPWQYVSLSESSYGRSFDLLYFSEELVLAASLLLVRRRSQGIWRSIYLQL